MRYWLRGKVCLAVSGVFIFHLLNAQGGLPPALTKALQKREQAYFNKRLVFQVELHTDAYTPDHFVTSTEYFLEILRATDAIKVNKKPVNSNPNPAPKIGDVVVIPESCYIGREGVVTDESNVVYEGNRPRSLGNLAFINRPSDDHPYIPPAGPYICREVSDIKGVFRAGLDVSKVYKAKWERVDEHTDYWILYGKVKRSHYGLPDEPLPDVELKVRLRKPDALPEYLEIRVPTDTSSERAMTSTDRVLKTTKMGSLEIPSVVESRYEAKGAYLTVEKSTLIRVEPLKEQVKLELPKDTQVVDERVNNTNYRWEGRLPSEEEVKQKALQQGRFLPEEAPRRRYSLVLFVPALLFFAAALYLYWKQRRR